MQAELPLLYYLSRLEELTERLVSGGSFILEAPKYYGKLQLARFLCKLLRTEYGFRVAELSSQTLLSAGDFDPSIIAGSFVEQLALQDRQDPDAVPEVVIYDAIRNSEVSTFVLLIGGGRRNVLNHFRLLALFDQLLQRLSARDEGKLSVVAIDDGSLFQRNDNIILPTDLLSFFKPIVRLRPLSPDDIRIASFKCCEGLAHLSQDRLEFVVSWIAEHTGGHHGLVAEILSSLKRNDELLSFDQLRVFLANTIGNSPIMDSLSEALRDDPEGLSSTALDYRSPQPPEPHSPRLNALCQLGILHRATASQKLALCSGAITRLVESVDERFRRAPNRIGTIISETGPRLFLDDELHPEDDDFIVLHLSDLHVGPDYQHAIRSRHYSANIEQHSLGDMLAEDLKRMEIWGRIDALVISGDLVGDAQKIDQFYRAREVVEEILEKIQIKRNRLLIIPGNHDVDWTPGAQANLEPGRAVSMENFRSFMELLKLPQKSLSPFLGITSRSGKVRLRIVGLDSNFVEGPESAGIGFVSEGSFKQAEIALAKDSVQFLNSEKKSRRVSIEREHTWLTLHHHLLPITAAPVNSARSRSVSVMANASVVLAHAVRWGVELALHGHEHQPAVTVARRWPAEAGLDFSPLSVVACGSVGAKVAQLGPFARNQYFIAYRRKNDIILRSRCMDEQGLRFGPHHDILIPQENLPNRNSTAY